MGLKRLAVVIPAFLLGVLAVVGLYFLLLRGDDEPTTVAQQVGPAGGRVELSDDVTLIVPPGALENEAAVSLTRASSQDAAPHGLEAAEPLAEAVNIDLGGQGLTKPATLEFKFDPELLPTDGMEETVFLAFYDEEKDTWTPVAGQVDTERNVIVVQTMHLSWWDPFSWNWGAWIAVLDQALLLNVTDFIQAVAVLTDDCPQSGPTVSVDSSRANNVVQGCVERDDAERPELRVVNPKSFFFRIRAVSGGNGYPQPSVLGPGESARFAADTYDSSPLVVAAEIDQQTGTYLVVHLIIQMLPGLNEVGIQGAQIACITERVDDISNIVAASEALVVDHDGAAAAEEITNMLLDEDAMRRFISAADDCYYGPARTWSLEGIRQVGAATSTIISATDFVANFLLNARSEVGFSWAVRVPTPTALPTARPTVSNGAENQSDLVRVAQAIVVNLYAEDLPAVASFYAPLRRAEVLAYLEQEVQRAKQAGTFPLQLTYIVGTEARPGIGFEPTIQVTVRYQISTGIACDAKVFFGLRDGTLLPVNSIVILSNGCLQHTFGGPLSGL
jgi:hypothetical protein